MADVKAEKVTDMTDALKEVSEPVAGAEKLQSKFSARRAYDDEHVTRTSPRSSTHSSRRAPISPILSWRWRFRARRSSSSLRARSARRGQRRQAAGHVIARHRARGNVHPVPAVDRHDCQTEMRQLVFRELLPHALVHVVRDVSF
jgi:hypothetical protein